MSLRSIARKLIETLSGTKIYSTVPRGIDFAQDIANSLPLYNANIVLDVGANVGQSASLFLDKFPSAHIYCFEPASNTYQKLQNKFKDNKRVDCYQMALGSSQNNGTMVLEGGSEMFFVLGQSKESPTSKDTPMEPVSIDTVDKFCQTHSINHINYLKIDTEGGDLDVLMGATGMLSEQKIDIVQVEAGMSATNTRHVPFESLKDFLQTHGYSLFAIYEQVYEWPTGEPHLRRTNPLFISQRLIQKNKKVSSVA